MRFAVLSHTSPQITKGGAELSAHALVSGLRELGHDASLICMIPEGASHRVWTKDGREVFIGYEPAHYDFFFHLADPFVQEKVVKAVLATKCDAVFANHFLYIGVNTLKRLVQEGLRVVLTLHEYLAICHSDGQLIMRDVQQVGYGASPSKCASCFHYKSAAQFASREASMKSMLNSLDGLISPSEFLRQRFASWGIDPDRIALIENGLPELRADPVIPRPRDGQYVFGYFGQITPYKGLDLLMDAADLLSAQEWQGAKPVIRVHGKFQGMRDDEVQLAKEVIAAHPMMEFHGPYDQFDVLQLMQQCDYVVMPSRWWENSPLIIQEAYAARTPLIVGAIGGMAEKVRDHVDGLHFEVLNTKDMARAMTEGCNEDLLTSFKENLPYPITARDMAARYMDVLKKGEGAVGRAR